MAIKQGNAQVSALTPIPILIYASWSYTEYRFKDLSSEISYQQARELSTDSHDMLYDLDVLCEETRNWGEDDATEGKDAPVCIELKHTRTNSALVHHNINCNPYNNATTARRDYQAPHLKEPIDSHPNVYRINNIPLFHMQGSNGFSLDPVYYEPPPLIALEEISVTYLQ